jgi:DNA gyrase/topoisomerase IV subunit A
MMAEKLLDLPLEDVLGDRFGRYSKYIIQERALPDVRDGVKAGAAPNFICDVHRWKHGR